MDIARRLLPWVFGVLALQCFYAVPYRLGELAGLEPDLRHIAGAAALVIGGLAAWTMRGSVQDLGTPLRRWLQSISNARWLAAVLLIGVALRLAWVMSFGFTAYSDSATYVGLAQSLAAGGAYETAGTRAYWPPGWPLFLTPLVALFGAGATLFVTLNLIFYAVATAAVFKLAQRLANNDVAKLASGLLCLWPNYIGMTGAPEKEALVIALMGLLALLAIDAAPAQARLHAGRMLLSGLVLGFMCLVQPSFILFWTALLAGWLASGTPVGAALTRTGVLIAGMALAIAPWTARNYQTFDQIVPISTNGGHNLYRANNPWADGTWQPAGARSHELAGADEVTIDQTAKAWAFEWISENPGDFLALALRKQLLFLGDSSGGMMNLRADDRYQATSAVWLSAKLVGNGAWLLLWGLLLAACLRLIATKRPANPRWVAPALYFLYFYAIHSVFESGAKYHLVALPMLLALAAAMIHRAMPPPETAA